MIHKLFQVKQKLRISIMGDQSSNVMRVYDTTSDDDTTLCVKINEKCDFVVATWAGLATSLYIYRLKPIYIQQS